jgi:hypothetical protein
LGSRNRGTQGKDESNEKHRTHVEYPLWRKGIFISGSEVTMIADF